MHHSIKKLIQPPSSPFKQRGAALIFMAFILGLGVAAYTIKAFNTASMQAQQDQKTLQTLGEAKKALIAWAVSHPNTPGLMPYPDRNADAGGYDGLSDCPGGATLPSHLIGRLPWKGGDYNNCSNLLGGLGEEFNDASNEPLWYAVSENLVHIYSPSGDPTINPNIIDNPPYGAWLEVYDKNGQLISDKVAAIIIAPGAPLDDQDRSSGIAGAPDYLDSFNLQAGGGTKSNRTYAGPDEDFYIGEDSRGVRSDNTTYQQPYYFNDKLVYITIDELMAALEKRVGEQARSSLKTYQDANGYYPFAAQLGTVVNYGGEVNLLSGFLPVDYQDCTYTRTSAVLSGLSCTQPIFDVNNPNDSDTSGIVQVRFTRSGGSNFTANTGSCSRTTTRCTCTGNGSCSNVSGLNFTCTTISCIASGSGAAGTYLITGGKFTSNAGGCTQTAGRPSKTSSCTNSNSLITCSTATAGSFRSTMDVRFDTNLPAWFETNMWQNYVFYQLTRPASLTVTVGNKTTEAAVVTLGRPINSPPFALSKGSGQVRNLPATQCSQLNEYLDSNENVSVNNVFEATSKPRASNYNDQTFIVAP
jgi:hypothetical protein